MVSPSYEAKASIVLLPPSVAVTVGDNPYLYLGGLDQALGVLQVKAASPEVSGPLLEKFPGSTIAMSKDGTTSGPIMAVTVAGPNATETMALLQASMDLIPATLASLQKEAKVPASSVITALPLSLDTKPTKIAKKQIQMTAMAALGGLAGTLLATGFIDRLMSREKGVRAKKKQASVPQKPLGPRGIAADKSEESVVPEAVADPRRKYQRRTGKGLAESNESVDVGT
ncbi:hypothetical protein AAGW05_03925 [Arthrobacter sp. LAPM80]|uniref:hypothetical protein n=1 Tax=Arthrobacter sp. LAPM80 TaxID=3141788 RepID=UPI00398AEB41